MSSKKKATGETIGPFSEQEYSEQQINLKDDEEHCDNKSIEEGNVPRGLQAYLIQSRMNKMETTNTISKIFGVIQNHVDYDLLNEPQIKAERYQLQSYIKYLNGQINKILKKQMSKHQAQSKKHHRKLYDNELSKEVECKQIKNNIHLVDLLRKQYYSLKEKLSRFQECPSKYKSDCQIEATRQQIRKIKVDLTQKKRKMVLNEKKIKVKDKSTDDRSKVYFDLQTQYVAFTRKREKYTKRIQEIQTETINLMDQQQQVKKKYKEKNEGVKQINKQIQNQAQQEHWKVLYNTNKRKLELVLRKRERQQEENKRKYYHLLKNYEKVNTQIQQLKQKQSKLEQDLRKYRHIYEKTKKQALSNQQSRISTRNMSLIQPRDQSNKENKSHESQEPQNLPSHKTEESCINGFMLTELQKLDQKSDDRQLGEKQSREKQQGEGQVKKFQIRKRLTLEKVKTEHLPDIDHKYNGAESEQQSGLKEKKSFRKSGVKLHSPSQLNQSRKKSVRSKRTKTQISSLPNYEKDAKIYPNKQQKLILETTTENKQKLKHKLKQLTYQLNRNHTFSKKNEDDTKKSELVAFPALKGETRSQYLTEQQIEEQLLHESIHRQAQQYTSDFQDLST